MLGEQTRPGPQLKSTLILPVSVREKVGAQAPPCACSCQLPLDLSIPVLPLSPYRLQTEIRCATKAIRPLGSNNVQRGSRRGEYAMPHPFANELGVTLTAQNDSKLVRVILVSYLESWSHRNAENVKVRKRERVTSRKMILTCDRSSGPFPLRLWGISLQRVDRLRMAVAAMWAASMSCV